jgi:hypothetical protein
MACLGEQDRAGQGKARQVKAWQGKKVQEKAWRSMSGQGVQVVAKQGMAGQAGKGKTN